MIFRIWREPDGFHVDVKPEAGEKEELDRLTGEGAFSTAHEARQAVKIVRDKIGRARTVVLERRPDDAE